MTLRCFCMLKYELSSYALTNGFQVEFSTLAPYMWPLTSSKTTEFQRVIGIEDETSLQWQIGALLTFVCRSSRPPVIASWTEVRNILVSNMFCCRTKAQMQCWPLCKFCSFSWLVSVKSLTARNLLSHFRGRHPPGEKTFGQVGL